MPRLITIQARNCGPEISNPGTLIPRTRTTIAFGARLNHVIECNIRKAKATRLFLRARFIEVWFAAP